MTEERENYTKLKQNFKKEETDRKKCIVKMANKTHLFLKKYQKY